MLNISTFLARFKHLKNPKIEREEISKVLGECLGFEITPDLVSLKNNIIHFGGSSLLKTEIYLKKEIILKTLENKFPHLHIKDIR